jgi:hypothetical protein
MTFVGGAGGRRREGSKRRVRSYGFDSGPTEGLKPQTSHPKALRSAISPRLGPLLQPCKMATARLSVKLDKRREQRHCRPTLPAVS